MRSRLTNVVIALLLSLAAYAQTREVTDSGTFVIDDAGRYVRLEGLDGVIVEYLYDGPDSPETSGIAVRVTGSRTLTVKSGGGGEIAAGCLPKLSSTFDSQGRTTSVLSGGTPLARIEYDGDGSVAGVSLARHFRWKLAPEASHRVRQTVESASGQVVAAATVKGLPDVGGRLRGPAYDAAAEELGIDLGTVSYERSPTGALTTARGANGRVAFYVVHMDAGDTGFSPEGKPLFYDLSLSVLTSKAWETQRGTVPDHLVLTAGGAVGLYVEDPAEGAIVSVWVDRAGKVYSSSTGRVRSK